jgi:hypothetical protein
MSNWQTEILPEARSPSTFAVQDVADSKMDHRIWQVDVDIFTDCDPHPERVPVLM